MVAVMGLFPLASPAQATHNCGEGPCPHVGDVMTILCARFPVIMKYLPQACYWT